MLLRVNEQRILHIKKKNYISLMGHAVAQLVEALR